MQVQTSLYEKICEVFGSLFPEIPLILFALVIMSFVTRIVRDVLFKKTNIPSIHAWSVILQLIFVVVAVGLILLDLSMVVSGMPDWIFLGAGGILFFVKDHLPDFLRMLKYPLRRHDSLTIGDENGFYEGMDLGGVYLRCPRDPKRLTRVPIGRVHDDIMFNDYQDSPRLRLEHYMDPESMDSNPILKAHDEIEAWFAEREDTLVLITNKMSDSYLYVIEFYIKTRVTTIRDRLTTEVDTVTIDILQDTGGVRVTQEPK